MTVREGLRVELRRPHRPVCLNSVPLPFETLEKILYLRMDYPYFKNQLDLAFKPDSVISSKKQSRSKGRMT